MIYFLLKLTNRKFIWALFLILMSCTTEEKTSKADSFLTFEMPEYLMGNNLNLKASTLADSIWYVPLQTSSKSLITDKIEHLKYKNGYFYLMDDYAKTIFVFSDKGKFIRTISNKGEGPKEFHWCYQLAVDDNHVYILDVLKKIRKYTLEGEWVKDIILPKQAYRLLSFGNGNLAGYISDDQFAQKEESYSWLIINSEGDSLTCINTNAWRKNKDMPNYWVANDFSSQHPFTYKEAYNDTLYYFQPNSYIPKAYYSISPGKHRLQADLTWNETMQEAHGLRISFIYDTPPLLMFKYRCLCTDKFEKEFLGAFDKKTGVFFNIKDENNKKKITNDIGGPNFIPYICVYPDLLIGIASVTDCSDNFQQTHQLKSDDNPILVLLKLKNKDIIL